MIKRVNADKLYVFCGSLRIPHIIGREHKQIYHTGHFRAPINIFLTKSLQKQFTTLDVILANIQAM